jgi:hypothetical protein
MEKDGSGESTKSYPLLTGGKILIVRAESVTIVRERRRSEEQCRTKLDAVFFLHLASLHGTEKGSLCTHSRFVALALSSRTSIAHTNIYNNKKKTRAIRLEQQRKEKSSRSGVGADKTLGPHIVGLKSYLIGKQFKINNPESVNWRCEQVRRVASLL